MTPEQLAELRVEFSQPGEDKRVLALLDHIDALEKERDEARADFALQPTTLENESFREAIRSELIRQWLSHDCQRVNSTLRRILRTLRDLWREHLRTERERDAALAELRALRERVEKEGHANDCGSRRLRLPPSPVFSKPVCRSFTGCGGCERCQWMANAPRVPGLCDCFKSRIGGAL